MNIKVVNLIHWACPMSVFLSFNERVNNLMNKIKNLMNEFYVDEFCYQKPTILSYNHGKNIWDKREIPHKFLKPQVIKKCYILDLRLRSLGSQDPKVLKFSN